jgi:hypothetical protein
MKPRLRAASPALIISLVALIVALGGGAAAYASGLISGSQIMNHSIAEKKLTKDAINGITANAYSVHADWIATPQGGYGKIASLPLAAGSYIITAKTVLDAPGNTGGTCKLTDTGAGNLDFSSHNTRDATLSLLAPLVTKGSTVELLCAGADTALPSVNAGFTHLVAIKVASVKGS